MMVRMEVLYRVAVDSTKKCTVHRNYSNLSLGKNIMQSSLASISKLAFGIEKDTQPDLLSQR